MAWNPEHKQQSKEKILIAAADLFAQYGFSGIGIDDIMKSAGLTRGAFYSHFKSKSQLYQESLIAATKRRYRSYLSKHQNAQSNVSPEQLVQAYLNMNHVNAEKEACPMAFLVTDIAQQDEHVRSAYTTLFEGFVERIGTICEQDREQHLRNIVLMIGGVAIARALDDSTLQEELLNACKAGVLAPQSV